MALLTCWCSGHAPHRGLLNDVPTRLRATGHSSHSPLEQEPSSYGHNFQMESLNEVLASHAYHPGYCLPLGS